MKTIISCIGLIVWSFQIYAQPNNFQEALERYLDLNLQRDSILVEVILFLDEIHIKGESVCDYSEHINTQIEIIDFISESIITILEGGNREDISPETRKETQDLVSDRRKRNAIVTSMLKKLIEPCTF